MRTLVIGDGGRESAACKALASDSNVHKVYCSPGNAGVWDFGRKMGRTWPGSLFALPRWARAEKIDLAFVGPEKPLFEGVQVLFRRTGISIVAPSPEAVAVTEESKYELQMMCRKHGVNIAPGECFDLAQSELARDYVNRHPEALVVKAEKPVRGKSVIVCDDQFQAKCAVTEMMEELTFGEAGRRIVIQHRLTGRERTFQVILGRDGYRIMRPVQDFKRAPNGLNTGGVASVLLPENDELTRKFEKLILLPTLEAFRSLGIVYEGILCADCMETEDNLYLLEYNSRFGDPQFQVLMAALKSPTLLEIFLAILNGTVLKLQLTWRQKSVVLLVGCAPGYPSHPVKHLPIWGLKEAKKFPLSKGYLLHAQTEQDIGQVISVGGRVLNFLGIGKTNKDALANARELSGIAGFDGMWLLPDLGID